MACRRSPKEVRSQEDVRVSRSLSKDNSPMANRTDFDRDRDPVVPQETLPVPCKKRDSRKTPSTLALGVFVNQQKRVGGVSGKAPCIRPCWERLSGRAESLHILIPMGSDIDARV